MECVCACSPGRGAAWSRRVERGRAGLCARVCARGRRPPLSRGLTAVQGMLHWSGPGRPHRAASRNPVPFLPLRPASPLRSDPDPPQGSSKAQRGAGGPWRLPSRSIASRRGARRVRGGGRNREDAAAASADEPGPATPVPALHSPLCPLSLQLEGGFPRPPPRPQHFLARPASPSAVSASLSPFHSPSRCPLIFSHPGVPGQGLRAGQWR